MGWRIKEKAPHRARSPEDLGSQTLRDTDASSGELYPGVPPASVSLWLNLGLENVPWAWTRMLSAGGHLQDAFQPPSSLPAVGHQVALVFPPRPEVGVTHCNGNRLWCWCPGAAQGRADPDTGFAVTQCSWLGKSPHILLLLLPLQPKGQLRCQQKCPREGSSGEITDPFNLGSRCRLSAGLAETSRKPGGSAVRALALGGPVGLFLKNLGKETGADITAVLTLLLFSRAEPSPPPSPVPVLFFRPWFSYLPSLFSSVNRKKKELASTSPRTWALSSRISQLYVPNEQRKSHHEGEERARQDSPCPQLHPQTRPGGGGQMDAESGLELGWEPPTGNSESGSKSMSDASV